MEEIVSNFIIAIKEAIKEAYSKARAKDVKRLSAYSGYSKDVVKHHFDMFVVGHGRIDKNDKIVFDDSLEFSGPKGKVILDRDGVIKYGKREVDSAITNVIEKSSIKSSLLKLGKKTAKRTEKYIQKVLGRPVQTSTNNLDILFDDDLENLFFPVLAGSGIRRLVSKRFPKYKIAMPEDRYPELVAVIFPTIVASNHQVKLFYRGKSFRELSLKELRKFFE